MADKLIDIREFREKGFLQELNRMFLHPLGMALTVIKEDDGTERLGGIIDHREDPEGMAFEDGAIDPDKIAYVGELWDSKIVARLELLGDVIQTVRR